MAGNIATIKYSDGRKDDTLEGGKYKVKHILEQEEKGSRLYEAGHRIPDGEQVLEGGHTYNVEIKDTEMEKAKTDTTEDCVHKGAQEFWRYLKEAEYNKTKQVLALARDTEWLGNVGALVYVRPCYEELANIILGVDEKLPRKLPSRFLLVGNPGIGKTYFSYYFFYRLAKAGVKTVVSAFIVGENTAVYRLYMGNYVSQANSELTSQMRNALANPQTWYIIDTNGVTEEGFKANILFVSSPDINHYKVFSKLRHVDTRYMPIPTLDEILNIRKSLYPDYDIGTITALYDKWGGISRYVIDGAEKPKRVERALEKAISSCDWSMINKYVGEKDAPDSISHKLLHIVVDCSADKIYDRYLDMHVAFASVYVSKRIADNFAISEKSNLLSFLKSSEGLGKASALRGNLFEGHAHNMLANGGSFKIRDLVNGKTSTLQLNSSTDELLYKATQISNLTTTQYGRPLSESFCAVDSVIIKPCCMFQMTVGKKHPISAKGVDTVLAYLPKQQVYNFYFVVPEGDLFGSYKQQKFLGANKKKLKNQEEYHQKIHQYVLEISLSSTRRQRAATPKKTTTPTKTPNKTTPKKTPKKTTPKKTTPKKTTPTKTTPKRTTPKKTTPKKTSDTPKATRKRARCEGVTTKNTQCKLPADSCNYHKSKKQKV